MQLGFVIDHTKCIGCHACTVACKAENDVPLGSFRTWVKYTEQGTFPEVKRSFGVLRCNQCTSAPCVTICPTGALSKMENGIVDVDPARCIGCKACMQGCPYDALYVNPHSGTAEKCHFCAHRVETGLAPACAVVCPTEAIIPGDFHDPESIVSRMKREHDLSARKVEAGTGPNVLYRDAAPAVIDPDLTNAAGGYLWSNRIEGMPLDAEKFQASLDEAEQQSRTTYDVDHPVHWGWKVSAYLFTKSVAAGGALAAALLTLGGAGDRATPLLVVALIALALTAALLVGDLKRPERFFYILAKPNWTSWITRGAFVISGFGAVTVLALLARIIPLPTPVDVMLQNVMIVGALLTAGYTGWLFAQSKGRVLWMRRGLWLHLMAQAMVAGCAVAFILYATTGAFAGMSRILTVAFGLALSTHLAFLLVEEHLAPRGRSREYRRAARLITRGPFAMGHWVGGLVLGVLVPALLVWVLPSPAAFVIAGGLALGGLYVEEDILVKAGQSPSIS